MGRMILASAFPCWEGRRDGVAPPSPNVLSLPPPLYARYMLDAPYTQKHEDILTLLYNCYLIK